MTLKMIQKPNTAMMSIMKMLIKGLDSHFRAVCYYSNLSKIEMIKTAILMRKRGDFLSSIQRTVAFICFKFLFKLSNKYFQTQNIKVLVLLFPQIYKLVYNKIRQQQPIRKYPFAIMQLTYEQKQQQLKQEKRALWVKEQKFIKKKIKQHDDFQWKLNELRFIAGVDISFSGKFQNGACSALVIYDTKYSKLVYEDYEYVKLQEPYIPGFLAFRELPPTLHLFEKLKSTHPQYWPQLIMVDGNGIVHKFNCGYACHLGVVLDLPTIGCAKTFFDIDGLHQQEVEDMLSNTLTKLKEHIKLKGKSGKEWCTAILTDPDQNQHLYVSVGTKISLDTATQIVLKFLKNETPQPIFKADRNSRKKIKQMAQHHYLNAPSYQMNYLAL